MRASRRRSPFALSSRRNRRVKVQEALIQNAERFVADVGSSRVALLTLTFAGNRTDKRSAERCFHSLTAGLLRREFGEWVKVAARQARGAWHYHVLVDCLVDVRSGFDFEACHEPGAPDGANAELRLLRRLLHRSLPRYGFGFAYDLSPVRNGAAVARYLARQLSDVVRNPPGRGYRLVSYSKRFPRVWRHRYSWAGDGSRRWRRLVGQVARVLGCVDMDDLARVLGSRWAFELGTCLDANPLLAARVDGHADLPPAELAVLRDDLTFELTRRLPHGPLNGELEEDDPARPFPIPAAVRAPAERADASGAQRVAASARAAKRRPRPRPPRGAQGRAGATPARLAAGEVDL